MHHCPNCENSVEILRLRCPACGLAFEGRFDQPRLARLEVAEQRLVEQIILAAGNLKDVAAELEISYPTLRKRLDNLITALRDLRAADEARTQDLLAAVEAGTLSPEEASRLIREMNGGT